jgi:hypothetical protein
VVNAIYVWAAEPAQAAVVGDIDPDAYTEPGTDFYALDDPGARPPDADLARLSALLGTDVLYVRSDSVSGAFEFYHWRSGEHLRALTFGTIDLSSAWERVEGRPEGWEQEAIFAPEDLALEPVMHLSDALLIS